MDEPWSICQRRKLFVPLKIRLVQQVGSLVRLLDLAYSKQKVCVAAMGVTVQGLRRIKKGSILLRHTSQNYGIHVLLLCFSIGTSIF